MCPPRAAAELETWIAISKRRKAAQQRPRCYQRIETRAPPSGESRDARVAAVPFGHALHDGESQPHAAAVALAAVSPAA